MTLGTIKTAVYARGFEDDQAARIVILANEVERRVLGAHRYSFMLASTTVAGVAGTSAYSVPAGVHHIESIRLSMPGVDYGEMDYADADDLLQWEAEDNGARYGYDSYRYWTEILPGTFRVWPAPIAAGTFTVRYIKLPTAMVADGDSPTIPAPYQDLIVAGVAEKLARRVKQRDTAADLKEELDGRVSEMRGQYGLKQRQTTTRVQRSGRRD